MSFSAPFILRPVASILIALGLMMAGIACYFLLPVASLPSVDIPTIRIMAFRPGADPATMAASVAAPLERRLGEISGLSELTSSSSLGATTITAQFDISKSPDSAARDVQAALNAAATDLPGDLPVRPFFRKMNPAAAPVLILALTSDTLLPSAIYDAADTIIAQRLSQVEGVADVSVNGAEQPAIRIRLDPARLAAMNLSLDSVAGAVVAANAFGPAGAYEGEKFRGDYDLSSQLFTPDDFSEITIRHGGGAVRLADIATVERGVRNTRSAGWVNRKPAVLLFITKQPDANVIETVDRVKALLPALKQWIPAGIDISVMTDRTTTIRASIVEIQRTLLISIALVMVVVFLFLRRRVLMIAAGITIPLSLAGTFILMYFARFSLDNISLMAVIVAVGFVVDDAIVMIENIYRNVEEGKPRLRAALDGARQIGFTVLSISLSLIAAFIPLLFLDGIPGKMFREFSLTLTFAIIVSTFVSLSITPMICGRFMPVATQGRQTWLDRAVENVLGKIIAFYGRSLRIMLRFRWLSLLVMAGTVILTLQLYKIVPKGYIPQDDTGLVFASTEASPDVSFPAMSTFQQQAAAVIETDPDVATLASFAGGGSVNQGRIFIALKPEGVRSGSSQQFIARMRSKLARVPGISVFMFPVQYLRAGGRQTKSQYQFTLWGTSLDELDEWTPKILARLRTMPELADVTTDRERGGLRANVRIDREAASRLGVAIQSIDAALNTAFGQRQASIIYTPRNQYRVVIEAIPSRQRDPEDISGLYVTGAGGLQIPLSSVARVERSATPLVVNHQGAFPAVTISFNLAPDTGLETATAAITEAVALMNPPDALRTDFAGDARDFRKSSSGQSRLIVIALVAVYLILGILYESLVHPLTILSTLPSAGLGALLALLMFGSELTLIAFIGIILLIGIVKKNGIMLVDFAIMAERTRGLAPEQSAYEAALERFRPILMTTLAALFGALPLAFATGAGSEMRRPLGITIAGGLILSQILTLYTTPVIYLLLAQFSRWCRQKFPGSKNDGRAENPGHNEVPAE